MDSILLLTFVLFSVCDLLEVILNCFGIFCSCSFSSLCLFVSVSVSLFLSPAHSPFLLLSLLSDVYVRIFIECNYYFDRHAIGIAELQSGKVCLVLQG